MACCWSGGESPPLVCRLLAEDIVDDGAEVLFRKNSVGVRLIGGRIVAQLHELLWFGAGFGLDVARVDF